MTFTEEQLKSFAAPLSVTEEEQCKNVVSMVRDALKRLGYVDEGQGLSKLYEDINDPTFSYQLYMRQPNSGKEIKIFLQGSYANNTNVRRQCDVDIAIVEEDIFQAEYPPGITKERYGFRDANVISNFKDDVENALIAKFNGDIERRNKSIKIHGNSYRKDADGVPCRRFRDYRQDAYLNPNNFVGGIVILADDGSRIINYPEQHLQEGRNKNNATNYYYKKMVRIAKKICNIMQGLNINSALDISSFGLESLLWNIPDDIYINGSIYRYTFQRILLYLSGNINLLPYYKEANGIKQLCEGRAETLKYAAFIADLYSFYDYNS